MPSFSLTIEVPLDEAEDRSALLVELGAAGVEIRDESTVPMPGLQRAQAGKALLIAWFGSRDAAEKAALDVEEPGEIAPVPDQDWSETWKQGLAPFSIGRILVRPSWTAVPHPPGEVEVVLDPGMAFGTGTHPTTALCLAGIDAALATRPGANLLDVGTGSGLLAIAAKKLGAGRVVATDNDPVALSVARENASLNQVALELSASPPEEVRGAFEIVVANILANTLVELANGLVSRLAAGGTLLLSGVLIHQEDEVRSAYLALGLERLPAEERRQGEWSLLVLRSRA